MRRKFPVFLKALILAVDLLLIAAGAYLSFFMLFPLPMPQDGIGSYYNILPVMLVSGAFLFHINDLLSLARKNFSAIMISLIAAIFNLLLIVMAASFIMEEFVYPHSMIILTAFVQFALLAVWNYLCWQIDRTFTQPKRVLVVGNQEECGRIITRLTAQPYFNYTVKYFCEACENQSWLKVEDDIDLVVVTSDVSLEDKAKLVDFCHSAGKQVFLAPDPYGLFCFNIELDKIDDIPVFRAKYLKPTLEKRILKRGLDLAVAVLAIILSAPLFVILALVIKLNSPGKVFYTQVRTGLDGKEFTLYKFRTMIENAERETGPIIAGEKDARITSAGRFMRAARLDELPQLINVLFGDMSIVGPRPERPVFVEQFIKEVPGYHYRHNVKPGITGMAQVHGKYNSTPYDKLVYDLIYIQKYSVLNDLVIMLQTVGVLLSKESTQGKIEPQITDLSQYEMVKTI
jgi:exopolysaccharide biosynthesis polyprenyl glycosylphosphotransferase